MTCCLFWWALGFGFLELYSENGILPGLTVGGEKVSEEHKAGPAGGVDGKGGLEGLTRRAIGSDSWVDPTLVEWPQNDFRLFVGDLCPSVGDELLGKTFSVYKSFAKARVVREKRSGDSKGFGFVSFLDPDDYTRAFKEWNGKYIGNRPIKLRKSTWKDRVDTSRRGGRGGGGVRGGGVGKKGRAGGGKKKAVFVISEGSSVSQ